MKKKIPTPESRATLSTFDGLHAKLAAAFGAELARCEAAGEAPSPAFLAQARQFLNDNSVNTPARDQRIDTLKQLMPNFDELEAGNVLPFAKESS